jgi:hypothetical protein
MLWNLASMLTAKTKQKQHFIEKFVNPIAVLFAIK